MTQIATTIEQSKDLLAAGIPSYTSDMHYHTVTSDDIIDEKHTLFVGYAPEATDIPAWTLGALLDYLPLGYMLNSVDGGQCVLIVPNNLNATFFGDGSLFRAVIKALIWCKKKGFEFKD